MDKPRLWTKNFTIITVGSAVSILGNAVSAFAMGLLTLDKTGSVFLYALFLAVNNLPKIIFPLIAGPFLDKRSRRKAVYTLDFISAGLFAVMFGITQSGYFSYPIFLALSLIIGCIDSVYMVAYDSFYPMLVTEGNFSKAYSISSMLYPIAYMMMPVAAYVYKTIGLPSLFFFNSVSFLIAAVFETKIKLEEVHIKDSGKEAFSFRVFIDEFRNGLRYIKGEKGLMVITMYFFINTCACQGMDTLWLPYLIKYPAKKKFAISMAVYVISCFLNGSVLFFPFVVMVIMFFIDGFLSVTSFSIRLSSTQSYIPENFRGRFNGVYQMACNAGIIIGQLSAGALAERYDIRLIIVGLMSLNLLAIFSIMFRGRRHVVPIYNRDV